MNIARYSWIVIRAVWICLILGALHLSCLGSVSRLYPSMAGRGDPWPVITLQRLQIMMALHHGESVSQIAKRLNVNSSHIYAEIQPLLEYHLLEIRNQRIIPSIFIADQKEAELTYDFAQIIGNRLAQVIIQDWNGIENTFSRLSIGRDCSLKKMGFMLIGSRIIDIGVLGALVRDKTLLAPAPHRPCPLQSDARYYFWIVEGKDTHLGKYGQEDTQLRWPGWHVLNFGQSKIDGKTNRKRTELEKKIVYMAQSDQISSPQKIAEYLKIPCLNPEESEIWELICTQQSRMLLMTLKENETEIRDFYRSLKSSGYSDDSFGDFFCWFYHLVMAATIDHLEKKGVIAIPTERCCGLVMYRNGSEGLLAD